jgi:hypothetical protein
MIQALGAYPMKKYIRAPLGSSKKFCYSLIFFLLLL